MNADASQVASQIDDQMERSSFFRRSVMVIAMIAIFGYVVAFIQADRGTVHYNAYVDAYNSCFHHIVDAGAVAVNCNYVPEVRGHLVAHRESFAVGDPFLNLSLSLTVAVMLSPLIHRCGSALVSRSQAYHDPQDGTVRHPA